MMNLKHDELRTLAAAVLHQAMRDAVTPLAHDPDGIRWEAIAFCTETSGSFAEWRAIWCDVVDIPEAQYRAEAHRRIRTGEAPAMPTTRPLEPRQVAA
jgi:hypothetical protein